MNTMQAIDIARRMAELGQETEACQAYTLAILDTKDPEIRFEAALYILENGGNYQVAYDVLLELHRNAAYQQDAFSILTDAFYEPNRKQMKTRYEKNCKLLSKYPYLFRKNFPKFEELPIQFYPFDDTLYIPYDKRTAQFGKKVNFNHPQITHYFFKDLSKPIQAADIYSQYELEYLRDNVRPSEYIGKDNHVYLHYTHWEEFCSYLQVLNMTDLLEWNKFVFLIEEEISNYPMDFPSEFGIDYSKYPLLPLQLEEFHKLIWHTQLSSHNGGDFFNEVLDDHPNVIIMPSIMHEDVQKALIELEDRINTPEPLTLQLSSTDAALKRSLIKYVGKDSLRSDKNRFLLAMLLNSSLSHLDLGSRIVPAIFYQPHFYNMDCCIGINEQNRAVFTSTQLDAVHNDPIFQQFSYVKTFTPMRRPTTSCAASARFQHRHMVKEREKPTTDNIYLITDNMLSHILNRTCMVDWQDRLFQDSVLVRFEDGKLNPKATFTALAEFLDIPYTGSMEYCSLVGEVNALSYEGNVVGFSTESVYRTYDEFMGSPERYLVEYFLRDIYKHYGYSFHYYDGKELTPEHLEQVLHTIHVTDNWMWDSYSILLKVQISDKIQETQAASVEFLGVPDVTVENAEEKIKDAFLQLNYNKRLQILQELLDKLQFMSANGQPLNFMPMLQLDPALLQNPIYH